ncbi:hypothetical protein AAVH_19413 [Aphelenchoides avenae]|nr:hypothetical protein AAVH_19413 [Aphelenchus avenae]
MDLPPPSDDELSLELGLEDTDTTTGSSAAKHSPSNDRLQQKPQSFGKAAFTPDGCVSVESKRYPDQFKSSGIKCTPIFVADGEITGRDPDCAGTIYGHLCQQPELAAQLKKKFAARRLSERKRSAPARLHYGLKPDSTEDQHDDKAASASPKGPASSKPSGPPRKRRRETYTKAANDENQAASGDETPRLPKRSRTVLQLKNGNGVGPAPGKPSNNAKYIRKVKAEVAEMKEGGEKAEELDHVTAPPEDKELHQPVAPKGDVAGSAAAASKATAYAANFGVAVKTTDPSVVLYENIFGDNYAFKLVQEKQVSRDDVVQTVCTYRCQGCMEVKARDQIKGDVPLVKTVDGEFVERDPDHPLGKTSLLRVND